MINKIFVTDSLSKRNQIMNAFLQGCCFIPPEDDSISTPSFMELGTHLVPSSRPTTAGSCIKSNDDNDDREVIVIKPCPGNIWLDLDEETSCSNIKSSSSSVNNSSTRVSSSREICIICSSRTPLVSPNRVKQTTVSAGQVLKKCPESSFYIPVSPQRPTSSNKLLDFLTMCLWKCTPGCQQLPTLRT